jgi:hypothetical protein
VRSRVCLPLKGLKGHLVTFLAPLQVEHNQAAQLCQLSPLSLALEAGAGEAGGKARTGVNKSETLEEEREVSAGESSPCPQPGVLVLP